jgi:hypothetical protein
MKYVVEKKFANKKLIGLLIFLLSFIFYVRTLAPTVTTGDAAKLAIFSYRLELNVALEYHNLHTLLGFLFNLLPFGDIAYRQNLMSAFFAALSVMLVYFIVLKLVNSRLSAFIAALSLTLSHTFWLLAVITETYSLLTFFLGLIILLLFCWEKSKNDRLIYIFSFVFGLSLCNNVLIFFFLPAFLYFILWKDPQLFFRKYRFLLSLVSFLIGFLPFIIVFAISLPESSWKELIASATITPWKRYYRPILKLIQEVLRYPTYLMYQFPLFGFIFGFLGLGKLFKEKFKISLFLLLIFLIDIIFSAGYMRQKEFNLLLPSYLIFSLWVGVGFSLFLNKCKDFFLRKNCNIKQIRWRIKMIIVLIIILVTGTPLVLYYITPILCDRFRIDLVKARTLPYRDNNRFFLYPGKDGYYEPYNFAKEVFEIVEPNSIIIADFTVFTVLKYFQEIKGWGRNVQWIFIDPPFKPLDSESMINDKIEKFSLYLADDWEPYYNTKDLRKKYSIIPCGPIFQIRKKIKLKG